MSFRGASLVFGLILLVAGGYPFASAASAGPMVRLLVGYCPTYFTGAAAVVEVNPLTAAWKVIHTVVLPSAVFGCVADYTPTYDVDRHDPNVLWLDFTSDVGLMVSVNMTDGATTHYSARTSFNFSGYENFKLLPSAASSSDGPDEMNGVTITVTEDGFCNNGCIAFGVLPLGTPAVPRPEYQQLSLLPFQSVADDTSFYAPATSSSLSTYSFYSNYDLRPVTCGPAPSSECIVTVDTQTGSLLAAMYTADYYIYRFARTSRSTSTSNVSVLSFVQTAECNGNSTSSSSLLATTTMKTSSSSKKRAHSRRHHSLNNQSADWGLGFAWVDPYTGAQVAQSCVSATFVDQEGPWMSAFSPDLSLFSTSSGNGDGDRTQFATMDPSTGAVVVNQPLAGLAAALKAEMGLVFVWALEFTQGAHPAAAMPHQRR